MPPVHRLDLIFAAGCGISRYAKGRCPLDSRAYAAGTPTRGAPKGAALWTPGGPCPAPAGALAPDPTLLSQLSSAAAGTGGFGSCIVKNCVSSLSANSNGLKGICNRVILHLY